jgi:hypothetical protein
MIGEMHDHPLSHQRRPQRFGKPRFVLDDQHSHSVVSQRSFWAAFGPLWQRTVAYQTRDGAGL